MAITKVAQFVTPPEAVGDYDAQNAHIAGFTRQLAGPSMALTQWENTTTIPALALGTYLSHGGYLYQVDTEDYVPGDAPTGDTTVWLRLEASGDTLVAVWIDTLASYVWNAVNNGLYNGNYQVLPYQLVKSGAVLTKQKIMNLWQGGGFQTVDYLGGVSVGGTLGVVGNATVGGTLGVTGAISGASLGVTGALAGATLDTGHGANELYGMDQAVKTNSTVHFANMNPPVDNNDVSMPAIGIGGFTFGYAADFSNITLPAGGTHMYLAYGNFSESIKRAAGGTVVANAKNIASWRLS